MPNFVERFSVDMKESLFRAAIDQRMGVRGALRAAKQGELEGLSAEHQEVLAGMTEGYAYDLVKTERDQRAGIVKLKTDTAESAREMSAAILALAKRDIQRMQREKAKIPVDTRQMRGLQAVIANAHSFTATLDAAGKAPAKPEPEKPKKPMSFHERIAAQARTVQEDAHTEVDDDGDHELATANNAEANTNDGSTSAVRLVAAQRGA